MQDRIAPIMLTNASTARVIISRRLMFVLRYRKPLRQRGKKGEPGRRERENAEM